MTHRGYSSALIFGICASSVLFACSDDSNSRDDSSGGNGGAGGATSDSGGTASDSGGSGGTAESGGTTGAEQISSPPTRPSKTLDQYAGKAELDAPPKLYPIDTNEDYQDRTQIQYLSGKGFDDAVDWEFSCSAGKQKNVWSYIGVPSNWEQYGFGSYSFGRTFMTTEKGLYRRRFTVPKEWEKKQVNLVFEGVMTDTEVLVNGKSAGPIHQGGFYSFQYDITALLRSDADNLLEVNVSKHSTDDSINKAERQGDYWVFGGIYRPVMLHAVPAESIDHIAVDARANGHLKVETKLKSLIEAGEVSLQLFDENLTKVGAPVVKAVSASDKSVTLEGIFPGLLSGLQKAHIAIEWP
ncbi:MAG: hypothetical protein QM784_07355 [Polyangiaceae bacterium]